MRKNLLQTLLVVVLSVIGVSQCWAAGSCAPFIYRGHKSNWAMWNTAISRSYNTLGNVIDVTSWPNDGYGDGLKLSQPDGSNAGTVIGYMMLTSYSPSVEPYTKVVLTLGYKLGCYSNLSYAIASLYKFDDENTAMTTSLDFTENLTDGTGGKYRFASLQNHTSKGWVTTSGTTDFVFDNLAGTTSQSISKYIMLVFVEGQKDNPAPKGGVYGANFMFPTSSYVYTYRKVITFDGNGSTGGSMDAQNIDNKGNLTTNAFARDGYTFNGWNTQADGTGTAYADGAEITATADSKGPVTLYAQWKRMVTLDAQSGTVSPTSINVNCYNTYSNLPTPTRTGYTFNGWFDAKTGGNQYTTTTASTNEIPATLYAQWKRTVTINKQDGTSTTTIEVNCNSTYSTLPADPSRTGYTFKGWFDATTGGNQYQKSTASTNDIPATLYAQWNAIDYTITYHENGGSVITEHKTYTIETATFALPVPTKDGYTFGGWFTNEACTEGPITEITQGSIGDKEFYAKWNENVVSDGTGKTLTEAQNEVNTALSTWKQECDGGKPINLTINRTIYKDGYYNTLCLPFDMSADQIAATFGDYKELKQFQSATVQGTGSSRSIVIEVENATTIEAGKAYLISFEKGTDLTTLTFNQVIVSTTAAPEESGTLAYQGILAPYQLPYGDQNYLFLGEKNTLYWPIDDGTFMKGFRAYFKVNTNPATAPYCVGMRAAFGSRQTPTDLSPAVSGQEVRKLLEQGRVVIVNKGVKYNMNGATVQ